MAPVTFKTVYLFLALIALPHVLAGPACAHRNRGKQGCLKKCKSRWGTNGHYMGQDKWGSVISSKDPNTDSDSILSTACGLNHTSTPEPALTPTTTPTDPSPAPSSKPPTLPSPSSDKPSDPSPSSNTSTSSRASTPTPSLSLPPPPSSQPPPPPPTTVVSSSSRRPPPSPQTSSPPPPKATPLSGGINTNSITNEVLAGHNSFRALHGASPLTWNNDLAAAAKSWASGCVFKHSSGQVGAFGENLAAGSGDFTVTDGINGWTDEAKDYNPQNPTFSHFTQVVWKGTTEVGCAMVVCPPGAIFEVSFGEVQYLTCEYFPPGNVLGGFDKNVQA